MGCGKEVLHFGDPIRPMTLRRRITVTKDDELASALERMRPYFPDKPAAALVHDLAIKGAVAFEEEEAGLVQARYSGTVWFVREVRPTRRAAAARSR
jgi:hypothetical protein